MAVTEISKVVGQLASIDGLFFAMFIISEYICQFFPIFYEFFLIYSDTKIPFGSVSQMSKKNVVDLFPNRLEKEGYYHLYFSFSFSSHSTPGRDEDELTRKKEDE